MTAGRRLFDSVWEYWKTPEVECAMFIVRVRVRRRHNVDDCGFSTA